MPTHGAPWIEASGQSHYQTYLTHLLDKPITDQQSIALRAMFGNQKLVIEQVNALMTGDADRGNSDNSDNILICDRPESR